MIDFHKMSRIFTCLSFLSLVDHGWMDSKWTLEKAPLPSSPGVSLLVELSGPENFVVLEGTNLTIRYRLSPQILNSSTPSLVSIPRPPLSFRLFRILSNGGEQFVSSQDILHGPPVSNLWEEVTFACGLIVRGGEYKVHVVDLSRGGGGDALFDETNGATTLSSSFSTRERDDMLGALVIKAKYPVITFEVPHRLETYSASVPVVFGLTHSLRCTPLTELPTTILVLSMCKHGDVDICSRTFVTVMRDPFKRLRDEGQVRVQLDCQYWGKNATYRIQIEDIENNHVIAASDAIRVEWSSRFELSLGRSSVLPCSSGKNFRIQVSYPQCILDKDKIRVFGHETTVPYYLAYNRRNYVGEQQIRQNRHFVDFPCSLFTSRVSRYCFQYVSTAVDDSVAVVVEKCIPAILPAQFSDGIKPPGWTSWSKWSECSETCGNKGKQQRYRFCDNPPPVLGGEICKGEAVEERACQVALPDCPNELAKESSKLGGNGNKEESSSDEDLIISSNQLTVETANSFSFIPIHPSLNTNLTQTYGCECGCILDDIPPGSNSSLVVILSSNQSSCGDQDEEDHHHLKWVLNARNGESRIRLDVVDVDLHCMKLAFRDGNTSDSNLLDVFTSSRTRTTAPSGDGFSRGDEPEEESLLRNNNNYYNKGGGGAAELQDFDSMTPPVSEMGTTTIRVESTGGSLSISASESNQENCAFQFLYLVAYYTATTLPTPAKSSAEQEVDDHGWNDEYEFWTFLLVKVVLAGCVVTVMCSMFGGCATKAYRKYKYEQLKWSDSEWKADDMEDGAGGGRGQSASRCTSITLMSFDYAYWRRVRLLRLKYFLLRPRKINLNTAKTKSYPSTPTQGSSRLQRMRLLAGESNKGDGNESVALHRNSLHHSLSETDLGADHDEFQASQDKNQVRQQQQRYSLNTCPKHGGTSRGQVSQESPDGTGNGETTLRYQRNGTQKCKLITTSEGKDNATKKKTLTKGGRRAFIAVTVPDDGDSVSSRESYFQNHQQHKKSESFNKKFKAHKLIMGSGESGSGGATNGRSASSASVDEHHKLHKLVLQRGKNLSQGSVTNMNNSLTHLSSSCDSQDRVGLEDDTDHDFEMDYYDYDVLNVGNIPGSYLGLEPTFVLWNTETVDSTQTDDVDQISTDTFESSGHSSRKDDASGDSIYSCLRSNEANNLDKSVTDKFSMEMKKVDSTQFNLVSSRVKCNSLTASVAETSLHEIKFADEDDYEDDNL